MKVDGNKNCTTCKFSHFGQCKGLKNDEVYQAIWKKESGLERMKLTHKHKKSKVCDEWKSPYIEYPLTVQGVENEKLDTSWRSEDIGKFCKIRPVNDNDDNNTFLGLYLGDLPSIISTTHNNDTGILTNRLRTNPAIFVFALNKVVYGYESWWGVLESEDELKNITDQDINDVWYVKALKSLQKKQI